MAALGNGGTLYRPYVIRSLGPAGDILPEEVTTPEIVGTLPVSPQNLQAIQEALAEVGFAIGMIGTFDKKQRSFKQVTSSGAVGFDVVVNCYKPKATGKNGISAGQVMP